MMPEKKEIIVADGEFCQMLHQGALEVLGETDLRILLVLSALKTDNNNDPIWKPISIDQVNRFLTALVKKYGLLSTRGISQLIGRAAFSSMRHTNKTIQEIGSIQRRLEPFSQRMLSGLREYFEMLQEHILIPITIIETTTGWQIEFNDDLKSGPACEVNAISFFLKGMLQEFLEWMDSRRNFKIEELDSAHKSSDICGLLIQVLLLD